MPALTPAPLAGVNPARYAARSFNAVDRVDQLSMTRQGDDPSQAMKSAEGIGRAMW